MITLHETLGGDFTEALNSEPQAVQSEAVGVGGGARNRGMDRLGLGVEALVGRILH